MGKGYFQPEPCSTKLPASSTGEAGAGCPPHSVLPHSQHLTVGQPMRPTPCPGHHGTLSTPRSPWHSPAVPSSGDTTLRGPSILSAHGFCSAWTDPARSDSGPVPRARSRCPVGPADGGPIVPGEEPGARQGPCQARHAVARAGRGPGTAALGTEGPLLGPHKGAVWAGPVPPPSAPQHGEQGRGTAGVRGLLAEKQRLNATERPLVNDPVQLAAARWFTQPRGGRWQTGMWQRRAPAPVGSGE